MKRTLIIIMLMLASTLTMAQLSPGAEGIKQKVAEYAQSQGMKVGNEGGALTIQRDTINYAVIFGGSNPVYVELRLFDLDITSCAPDPIAKTANFINLTRSAVKASITPDKSTMRFSMEYNVNDAQSVINTLKLNMDNLNTAWKLSREKYDEFAANATFANLRIPFEIYSADIVNMDKDDKLINDIHTDIIAAQTQYINASLTMIVYEDGDYPIGVQFITPDGNVSKAENDGSPYSFMTTMHLTQQQSGYLTGGWGSPNPGTWGPGDYQIVFFYKDKPFYAKKFTIY